MHKITYGCLIICCLVMQTGCNENGRNNSKGGADRSLTNEETAAASPASATPTNLPPITDRSTYAWSILPPGNGNASGITKAFRYTEMAMYDSVDNALVDGTLNDTTLPDYYKNSKLGVQGETYAEQSPKPEVSIRWDKFGVPHVFAEKATDVAYGAGFATAEARNVMAELIRAMGKSGLVELGTDPSKIFDHFEEVIKKPAINYSKAELAQQFDHACALDPAHCEQLLALAQAYVDGINDWYYQRFPVLKRLGKLGILWPKWQKADITASGIMISSMFGAGGGNEVANGDALRTLTQKFGEPIALALFHDLRLQHTDKAIFQSASDNCFPRYENGVCERDPQHQIDPNAIAVLDDVTEVTNLVSGENLLRQKHKLPSASNFLIAGAEKMAVGHPALAGGPQTGYASPELLMEIELNGGGYRATGMTVPGIAMLVLVGHTDHYGWTITAGASDLVDLRAEKLCEPDGSVATLNSNYYWFKQQCIPLQLGKNARTLSRSVHGPIIARGTVQGMPVAISHQRASRGFESDAAVSLRRLNFGEVEAAADFPKALDEVPYSMNWGYLNNHEIAYIHSGRFPIRKAGVSANLPSWGTGEWEWQGTLPLAQKAFDVNPEKNYLTSWNNRVALNWDTSDDDWGTGNYHRIQMLDSRIKTASNLTVLELNQKVLDAATEDHHGTVLLSRLETLLPAQTAPDEELKNLYAFLQAWRANGNHRRDYDYNNEYDDSAVTLFDEFKVQLINRIMDDNLADVRSKLPLPPLNDGADGTGSAFQHGQMQYVLTALDKILSSDNDDRGIHCADASLAGCQQLIWSTLANSYATLQEKLGRSDFTQWKTSTLKERITFVPEETQAHSMRWSNRATFQQILSFE